MSQKTKVCKRCHKRLPVTTDFFCVDRRGTASLRATCKMCESNMRHAEDRWKLKAQDTRAYHRLMALEQYKISPESFSSWDGHYETFDKTYGWDAEKIAREMEAVYEGPCRICGKPYKTMGHGRHDLTVDLLDPTSEPFYEDNTRFVCGSCNSRKGAKTREQDRQAKAAYQRWLDTGREHHQLSFLLIPGSPGNLPDVPVQGAAVPAKEKSAPDKAGAQMQLF